MTRSVGSSFFPTLCTLKAIDSGGAQAGRTVNLFNSSSLLIFKAIDALRTVRNSVSMHLYCRLLIDDEAEPVGRAIFHLRDLPLEAPSLMLS
ncbi:hypothetical protein [Rhizobium lentis]|uniref:Uncharacterized protein n=1 Tax=Rhizobium lentis TaxID=1138194 RepID=A0A7W9CYF0_9HYPH|nr:hypothetical protein [Rhizobium lentis]MBB4577120.1 hypothetical protein [Rhizobium lentis]MBB5553975.1 hypothetical protein [Rhizobium lentis]MBB5564537.1 hypothetical protein [Rhizobium lentis]MBB5571053.1 hypothetical protein [Rhizobium lentis]